MFYTSPNGDPDPGIDPRSVAVGDIDNDGKPDVAVVYAASFNVKIYHNTGSWSGTGGLTLSATLDGMDTGYTPQKCAFGHISLPGHTPADNYLDLVVVASIPASVSTPTKVYVYLNDGSGGFLSPVTYEVLPDFNSPYHRTLYLGSGVSIRDLDADGINDIIVAGSVVESFDDDSQKFSAIGVLWGQSDGSKTIATYYNGYDQDGQHLDCTSWHWQTGGGGDAPSGLDSLDTVTTKNYVAAASATTLHLRIYEFDAGDPNVRNLDATNHLYTYDSAAKGGGITAAYLNSDGYIDLAISEYHDTDPNQAKTVYWYKATSSYQFTAKSETYQTNIGSTAVASGYLYNPTYSRPDVVCVDTGDDGGHSWGELYVLVTTNTESSKFAPRSSFALGVSHPAPQDVALGDLNGDGLPDIVVANRGEAGQDASESVSVLLDQACP